MKKKLLYVINALAIHGGLERIIIDKVNWLAMNTDYEVHLVTFSQGSHPVVYPLHPDVIYDDLDIVFHRQYQYKGLRRWHYNLQLRRLFRQRLSQKIREISPHLVLCSQKQFIADVDKARADIPLVFECHSARLDSQFEGLPFWKQLEYRSYDKAISKAEMVVALTEGDAREWRQLTSHVAVIPNMVQLNETGHYGDCLSNSVIFVGRYTVQKDIGSLLRIWQIVNKRHPDWTLHMYGGYGNQYRNWVDVVKQKDIQVEVHESIDRIFDKYMESSMLLLTSIYEPFGLVLPEAMSCGIPVVSFDCPYGPAEIVTHGKDGFLIKDRNIAEFADRVCQLIEHRELRQAMGRAAIASVQRYRSDRIMPKWVSLIEEMTSKG